MVSQESCVPPVDRTRPREILRPPREHARFVRKTSAWAVTSTGLSNKPRQHSRGRKEALEGSERAERARGCTLHRAPAGQGPPGPDWLAISFWFWSGQGGNTGVFGLVRLSQENDYFFARKRASFFLGFFFSRVSAKQKKMFFWCFLVFLCFLGVFFFVFRALARIFFFGFFSN